MQQQRGLLTFLVLHIICYVFLSMFLSVFHASFHKILTLTLHSCVSVGQSRVCINTNFYSSSLIVIKEITMKHYHLVYFSGTDFLSQTCWSTTRKTQAQINYCSLQAALLRSVCIIKRSKSVFICVTRTQCHVM